MLKNTSVKNIRPWAIVITAMLFYAYNYLLRTSPSTMMQPLLQHFHIDAAVFGSLAAFYYYIYTPMQIPVGILVDRYRVRFILVAACATSILGLLIFVVANQLWLACVGRLLIGFGCAFAYISVIKLATEWLPVNRFATAAGLTTAFGMLAGASSDVFLTKMVTHYGYEQALHGILVLGILLVVLLLAIIRDKKSYLSQDTQSIKPLPFKDLIMALKRMTLNRQMWLIAIFGCLAYLPASVFLDVWGLPYLMSAHHLSSDQAGFAISLVFMGWIISGPLIGSLSDRIRRRQLPIRVASFGILLISTFILYGPVMNLKALSLLLLLFGFFAGVHPLVFALGRENNPDQFAATATAFLNTIIMLGGVVFQPVVGLLLDLHHGKISQGVSAYAPGDYRFALSILPIFLLISFIITFFIKETYCEGGKKISQTIVHSNELGTSSIV